MPVYRPMSVIGGVKQDIQSIQNFSNAPIKVSSHRWADEVSNVPWERTALKVVVYTRPNSCGRIITDWTDGRDTE